MSKTVFILGAGASFEAGVPLMGRFFEAVQELVDARRVPEAEADFQSVLEARAALSRTHSKARLDLDNVESVFTAFEFARTVGRLGDYDVAGIEALSTAMRRLITKTVEQTLVVPLSDEGGIRPPAGYSPFAAVLQFLMGFAEPRHSVAVITFNYDLALDVTFHYNTLLPDYGLGPPRQRGGVPLLKLHGSINWGRCKVCDGVRAWPMASFLGRFKHTSPPGDRTTRLPVGSAIPEFRYECTGESDGTDGPSQKHLADFESLPVLVPPTWNKEEYHRGLAGVWNRAADELSDAENIFVLGYSFPESDQFFQYLYALGTVGSRTLRRLWVFNPDKSREARFKGMVGQGAERAFRFEALDFDQALPLIKSEFD